MQNPILRRTTVCLLAAAALFFIVLTAVQEAEARAPRGGRSFSGSRTFYRPSAPLRTSPGTGSSTFNRQPFGGGSFMRGLGGGLLGGMIGGMLFGRPAYGGMGGFGGSGIGLIEIMLFGGLAWFLFKRFSQTSGTRRFQQGGGRRSGWDDYDYHPKAEIDDRGAMPDIAPAGVGGQGIAAVRRSDPSFDPDLFLEGAQDIFFKVQAAWMRQDLSLAEGLIGDRLSAEYRRQMDDLKTRGRINRLENIAVRSVKIVDAGVDQGHAWVMVDFTANLLDYTVNDQTGEVVEGDSANPVKFHERWTFAAPEGTSAWKLEGIE